MVKVDSGTGVTLELMLPSLLKETVYSRLMDSLKKGDLLVKLDLEFFGTLVMVKFASHMLGKDLVLLILLEMPMLPIQMLQLDLEDFMDFLVLQNLQHSYLELKSILYSSQAKQELLLHYPMLVLVLSPHFLEQQNPLLTIQKIVRYYSILLEDLSTGLQKITLLMLVLLLSLDLLTNPLLERTIQELVRLILLTMQKKEPLLSKKVMVLSLHSVEQQNVLPSVQMKSKCSSLSMDMDISFEQEHTSVKSKFSSVVLLSPTHLGDTTEVKVTPMLEVVLLSNLFMQHLLEPMVGSYKIYK